ncbi:MAG: UPF0236 family transposase-like protein, partial [Verrucomicrobiota bacterium]
MLQELDEGHRNNDDLTQVVRCCRNFYNLAIPILYSSFNGETKARSFALLQTLLKAPGLGCHFQRLIGLCQAQTPTGTAAAQWEILVRTAVFKPANDLLAWLFQQAADRIDAAYQAKPGETLKRREKLEVQGIFGRFTLARDYYYQAGKQQGHFPADAALGLEGGYTPALAKLICLEGADEPAFMKAESHLQHTAGIAVSARQIQRVVQRVGIEAQVWQERPAQPGACDAKVLYVSADGTGVPMVAEELKGRRGKQPDGTAKTRQAYLGCVFTQHKVDEAGHPVRDYESTTYVSSLRP